MPTRIIAFANQKGGVGKTTTVVNLAFILASMGKRTLLVDIDPQANATMAVLGQQEPVVTTYEFLLPGGSFEKTVIHTTRERLDLLPSKTDLAGAEVELRKVQGGLSILRGRLAKAAADYDFVLIDPPPSLGLLTVNALTASYEVIVPVSASLFALKGLTKLEQTIATVHDNFKGSQVHISGVVVTLYDHTNVASETYEILKRRYGKQLFAAYIPKSVKLIEAVGRAQSITEYAPDSSGALAYQQLAKEVVRRG